MTARAGLHPKLAARGRWAGQGQAPIVRGWVIRVDVGHLPGPRGRVKKTLWLWWSGPPGMNPDPELCWRAYIHRFDIEHAIKFQKATLGWVTPSLRHPGQAGRWTAVIIASYAQLVLARPLAADQRLPWERPRDPARHERAAAGQFPQINHAHPARRPVLHGSRLPRPGIVQLAATASRPPSGRRCTMASPA